MGVSWKQNLEGGFRVSENEALTIPPKIVHFNKGEFTEGSLGCGCLWVALLLWVCRQVSGVKPEAADGKKSCLQILQILCKICLSKIKVLPLPDGSSPKESTCHVERDTTNH